MDLPRIVARLSGQQVKTAVQHLRAAQTASVERLREVVSQLKVAAGAPLYQPPVPSAGGSVVPTPGVPQVAPAPVAPPPAPVVSQAAPVSPAPTPVVSPAPVSPAPKSYVQQVDGRSAFNHHGYTQDLKGYADKGDDAGISQHLEQLSTLDPANRFAASTTAASLLGDKSPAGIRASNMASAAQREIAQGGDTAQQQNTQADLQRAYQEAEATRGGMDVNTMGKAVNLAGSTPEILGGSATGAKMLGLTPEKFKDAQALFGKDPKAFQELASRVGGDKAVEMGKTLQQTLQGKPKVDAQGQPVVGPDGKPAIEPPGIMDVVGNLFKSDPATAVMAIGGVLAMLFGGKTGMILGALAAAGGAYRLHDRYQQVMSGEGAKGLQGMHALAEKTGDPTWADTTAEGLKRNMSRPEFAQMGFDPQKLYQPMVDTASAFQLGIAQHFMTPEKLQSAGQAQAQQLTQGNWQAPQ